MQLGAIKPVDATPQSAPADRQQQSPDNHPKPTPEDIKSRFEAVSEDGKEIVYRAIDPETGIVLAEVPSEEVRRVAQRLQQLIAEGKIE